MDLTEYQRKQLALIQKWEKREPSIASKAMGKIMGPFTKLFTKIVPDKLIESALKGANEAAIYFTDTNDVKRDGKVDNIAELRKKDLELSDKLADSVRKWAIGTAMAEGATIGAAGGATIAIDIPFIITFALRTIYKIGACYGYDINPSNVEEENVFALGVLSLASANNMDEKTAILVTLKQASIMIQKNTWKKIGEMASKNFLAKGILSIKQAAKMIGINLTKRKSLQSIPVIGGGVAALMNGSFINDIARAAQKSYQKRWLRDNGLIQMEESIEDLNTDEVN